MKKSLILIGISFILILVYIFSSNSSSNEADPTTGFKTTEVLRGDLTVNISATGIVEPNFKVEVKSKASGEVLKFAYEEGDRVEKGTLLLQLDKSDEQRNVAKARAVPPLTLEIPDAMIWPSSIIFSIITPVMGAKISVSSNRS